MDTDILVVYLWADVPFLTVTFSHIVLVSVFIVWIPTYFWYTSGQMSNS